MGRMEVSEASDEVLEPDFIKEEEDQRNINNCDLIDLPEPSQTLSILDSNCMGQQQQRQRVPSRWAAFLPPAEKFNFEKEESDDPEEECGSHRKKQKIFRTNVRVGKEVSYTDSSTTEPFFAENKNISRTNLNFSENSSIPNLKRTNSEPEKTNIEVKKRKTELSIKPAFSRWNKFS